MTGHFKIDILWKRTNDFSYEKFNRNHTVNFSGKQILNNSSAPEYFGDTNMSNPEELLTASLATCHMLTFLTVASKSGYIVNSYNDHAIATLDKNESGKLAITTIDLKPVAQFEGAKIPTEKQLISLHDKAHKNCFIANSIKVKVNINCHGRSL